jgi:hypothetical protein
MADVTAGNELKLTKSEQKAEAKMLMGRLQEIKSLAENTNLSLTQKKELRQEVKNIQNKLQKLDGVTLYLSFGAIIIILLLILLI